jgi:hypothetical protein
MGEFRRYYLISKIFILVRSYQPYDSQQTQRYPTVSMPFCRHNSDPIMHTE